MKDKALRRVLFISFDHVGDLLRYTPLLRTLRRAYPSAHLAVLAAEAPGQILSRNPDIDLLMLYPHGAVRDALKEQQDMTPAARRYAWEFIEMLKGMAFDVIINPFGPLAAMIAGMVAPREVLGEAMISWGECEVFGEHARAFHHAMTRENRHLGFSGMRLSDAALEILRDLNISPAQYVREPVFLLGAPERAFASRFLTEHGVTNEDLLIGIQTGALLNSERLWPLEKFASLINELACYDAPLKKPIRFVLMGTAKDRKRMERDLLPLLKVPYLLAAGETSLLEAGALLERMTLVVTLDTGPMHMAAALGIPTVALFGRTSCVPEEARPFGEGHTVLVGERTSDISVGAVLEAVKARLISLMSQQRESTLF